MESQIYLVQEGDRLIPMRERAYDSEDQLQALIGKYPNLLAGGQIDGVAPRRWLVVSSEAGLPSEEGGADRWAVDYLLIDQDAVPTLVEVKRSSDTRIRREVVGQMLDYAANAVAYWSVEAMRTAFEMRCKGDNADHEQVLVDFLDSDIDPEAFWEQVKTQLAAGKLRLVFVADEIPLELQRIVGFLNEQMDPAEVLAVEVKQYVGEGRATLVPRVIGQEAKVVKERWDEQSFFAALRRRTSVAEEKAAKSLLNWARGRALRIWWGRGARSGSWFPCLDRGDVSYSPISVWTYGRVEIQFQSLCQRPPFDNEDERAQLAERLNEIPGVDIAPEALERRPAFSLSALTDDASLTRFLEAMDWFITRVKAFD